MTKTLSMVSHKNYNFSVNKGVIIFLTSKWITRFIGDFTLKWNPSQLLIYSSKVDIYIGFGTLKVKCTQYGICGPSRMLGQWFFQNWAGGQPFRSGTKNLGILVGRLPLPKYSSLEKFVGGGNLTSSSWNPLAQPPLASMNMTFGNIHLDRSNLLDADFGK